MDPVTSAYLAECSASGSTLRGAMSAARERLPLHLEKRWGASLLPRPVFLPRHELTCFADDLAALVMLLWSLPSRLFDGDLGRYCEAVGIDHGRAELLSDARDLAPPVYGRADAYHDGERLRLLEFNVGSEVGGIDTAAVGEALLSVDPFRRFADEQSLHHVDTGLELARTLRAAALHLTDGDRAPVVALVEPDGGMGDYLAASVSFAEMLRVHGIPTTLVEMNELTEVGGRTRAAGTDVDVVLRYFTEDELVSDPRSIAALRRLTDAHRAGRVVLWTPMSSKLLASKGCLALVSDPDCAPMLTEAERATVDRLLPWTRTLSRAAANATAELIDHCREHRDAMLVKPRLGHDGVGITAGWRCTDAEWADALEAAASVGSVVQRRVRPRPEVFWHERSGEWTTLGTTLSTFVMPQGYAGTTARTLPLDNESRVRGLTPVFDTTPPTGS